MASQLVSAHSDMSVDGAVLIRGGEEGGGELIRANTASHLRKIASF